MFNRFILVCSLFFFGFFPNYSFSSVLNLQGTAVGTIADGISAIPVKELDFGVIDMPVGTYTGDYTVEISDKGIDCPTIFTCYGGAAGELLIVGKTSHTGMNISVDETKITNDKGSYLTPTITVVKSSQGDDFSKYYIYGSFKINTYTDVGKFVGYVPLNINY